MKRSILIGICALLGVATSMAQTYVVEGLYRDCAKASEHAPGESLMSRLSISAAFGEKEKEAMLPDGTEVTLLSDRPGRMVQVQYEGEAWWMDARELRLADTNPPGTADVLAGLDFSPAPIEMHLADDTVAYANTMERGTAEWAFMHSLVPPVLILLLVAALVVLLWSAAPDEFHAGMTPLRRLALWIAPALMLTVAALEAWYLLRMGGESYWWCSLYYYPKWGAALRWIPYALVVVGQWVAFRQFYMLLNNVSGKSIVAGRVWMVVLTVAAVVAGCVLSFVLHPGWADAHTLDDAVAWLRSWVTYAVVLGLVFPIIYIYVRQAAQPPAGRAGGRGGLGVHGGFGMAQRAVPRRLVDDAQGHPHPAAGHRHGGGIHDVPQPLQDGEDRHAPRHHPHGGRRRPRGERKHHLPRRDAHGVQIASCTSLGRDKAGLVSTAVRAPHRHANGKSSIVKL